MNKTPNWKIAQKREEACEAVRILMESTYLQKRITFLENAVSVLLKPEQIKGLHLVNRYTARETK